MVLSRAALAMLGALSLWAPIAGSAKDGPAPAAPAARSFKLGALKLTALRGGGWQAANDGTVFGLNASQAAVTDLLAKAGARTDLVTLDVDALLVRLSGRLVLIDAGLGPADHGVIVASLALAGVKPGEVTDVLITHGHTDHVDGLVGADGGPAFPNAVIRMSAREWGSMQRDRWEAATARVISEQVKVFEPGAEILPGITPVALYGHTPGHVGYEIVSRGRRLIDTGDLAHSALISLARPDWTIDFDVDRTLGARTRRAELTRIASAHERVFAPHFPFPGVGYIRKAGDGFAWEPAIGR